MDVIPFKVQLISILMVLVFMYVVIRLIIRGKLREEYSIVWILGTIVLVVFSIWRQGLQDIAALLNVSYAPSLLFLIAIFAIICFLLHLSIVISKLQTQVKDLAYALALLKQEQTVPPSVVSATEPGSAPAQTKEPDVTINPTRTHS